MYQLSIFKLQRSPPRGINTVKMLRTVKRKHRLWQRYLETRDGQIYTKFKKARSKVKSGIRRYNRTSLKIAKDVKKIKKDSGLM